MRISWRFTKTVDFDEVFEKIYDMVNKFEKNLNEIPPSSFTLLER